ncbi:transcriptional regulator [Agarivorans sp. B2Z047]|uniref:Mor transcription activator family protein n=1 Tax=Agarivorans sp. B2Z047 TaxID=2652721 RepID=UPI00128CA09D|nr:Mor transcription activator family protein [Agarivorans sp. B2Z047]MPW31803.1 transcriptional regulator [Agarivorans sp. B2Z047]UQN43733.1 hypothetical protein LQZ07_04485 [Agarivorans sp. B2Z047]
MTKPLGEAFDNTLSQESWPQATKEIFEILEAELKAHEADPALAMPLLLALAREFGGLQVYFPKGKSIEAHFRDRQIWEEFNGKNVVDLVRKFSVTHETVYKAIRKIRKLEMDKRQVEPF